LLPDGVFLFWPRWPIDVAEGSLRPEPTREPHEILQARSSCFQKERRTVMDYENVFIVLMVGGTLYILMSRFIGMGYHHGRCGGYAPYRKGQSNEVVGAARAKTSIMIRDLVCGAVMPIEQARAAVDYDGQTYRFCSSHCEKLFRRDPSRYIW
jgi:YHS domain-containing protein